MKQKALAFVSLFVILVALAGCAIGPAAAPASKELNVLCTPQEEWCQGMKQEFEKKYGVTVNYVRMSSGEALARIKAEKDNPQFDIWWGGPMDGFVAAKQDGLLEAYNSPNYANLLDQTKYKDADNQYSGIYVGSLGFCTNKDWLAKNPGISAPKSWEDLLKPEFKGQIMVAHPSTSGTSYTASAPSCRGSAKRRAGSISSSTQGRSRSTPRAARRPLSSWARAKQGSASFSRTTSSTRSTTTRPRWS